VRRSWRYRCDLVGLPAVVSTCFQRRGSMRTFLSLSFSVFSSLLALAACRFSCLAVNYGKY